MAFTAAAPSRLIEKEHAEKSKRTATKEDRPCSRCGHLRSAHAPPNYTLMHCEADACSCDSYFPPKSYEAVVNENLALQKRVAELEATIEQLRAQVQKVATSA